MALVLAIDPPVFTEDVSILTRCIILVDVASKAILNRRDPQSAKEMRQLGFADTDPQTWSRDARLALAKLVARQYELSVSVPHMAFSFIDELRDRTIIDGIPMVIYTDGSWIPLKDVVGAKGQSARHIYKINTLT